MLSNSKTKLKKVLILFMVITLTYSNFLIVGANFYRGLNSYAVDETVFPSEIIVKDELEKEPVFEIDVNTLDIHKTQMKEETEFTNTVNLKLKNVKNIQLEDIENNFYDSKDEESEIAKLKYVKTQLNKEQLENVLGKEGVLTILDNQNNSIATLSLDYIDKLELDSKNPQTYKKIVEFEDEDGSIKTKEVEEIGSYVISHEDSIEIEYNIEIKEIKTVINTRINNIEENFVIENTKSIFDVQNMDSLNYLTQNIKYFYEEIDDIENKEEIDNKEDILIEEENNELEEENLIVENTIKFKNTFTRASLNVDNLEWTLNATNNVTFAITLDTEQEDSEMFKDPIIIMELPECVEKVNSENSLFTIENDEGAFEDKNVTIVSLLGRKYIIMRLIGEQNEETTANENTNILLSLELETKDSTEEFDELNVYYKNDVVTAYNSGAAFDTILQKIALKNIIVEEQNEENIEEINETVEQETEDEIIYNEEDIEIMENIEPSEFYITAKSNKEMVKVGDEFNYNIYINNSLLEPINVELEDVIPDGLEYVGTQIFNYNPETTGYTDEVNSEDLVKYNKESKTLRINFNNYPAATIDEKDNSLTLAETKMIIIKVKPTNLNTNEYSRVINNEVKVIKNGKDEVTESIEVTVSAPILEVKINEIENELNLGDLAEFEVTVKNLGLIAEDNTKIEYVLPEELNSGYVETEDYSYSVEGNKVVANIYVPAEGSYSMKLFATYKENVEKDKDVKIYANIDENITNTWSTMLLKEDEPQEEIQNVTENINENNEENVFVQVETNETTETQDVAKDTQESKEQVFSLSLSQYLNRITVTDSQNTIEYNYDNAKEAKIELLPEQIDNSTVTMEYKIVVENNGTVPGYATQVVDNIPEGFEFNKEENPDWNVADDGSIYSEILKEKLLNPGEKAVLAVTLSKKITDNNFGTIKNVAQISKTSNDLNLENQGLLISSAEQNNLDTVNVTMAKKNNNALYIIIAIITIIIATVICVIIKHKKSTEHKEGC